MLKKSNAIRYILIGFIILSIGKIIVYYSDSSKKETVDVKNDIRKKNVSKIDENVPDEFYELELKYLGSAKVKEKRALLKDEQECAVYKDNAKHYIYTYAYRLFSSKEEYDS